MAELIDRATAVVQRHGGAVDKFTGDGVMAVFGAPVALEDRAFRACLAASDIQQQTGNWPRRSMHATASPYSCGWVSTPVR